MNPIFWFLVLIEIVVLWFTISFIFVPLGTTLLEKWTKTMEILNKDTQQQTEIEKEKDENE